MFLTKSTIGLSFSDAFDGHKFRQSKPQQRNLELGGTFVNIALVETATWFFAIPRSEFGGSRGFPFKTSFKSIPLLRNACFESK